MTSISRRESACRSLFGPVDHEQLRRDLKHRLREMSEQDSRRWNFNFQAETPLPGRFQWEEIPSDCAAAFYLEPAEPREAAGSPGTEDEDGGGAGGGDGDGGGGDRGGSAGTDQENCPRISNTKRPAEGTPVRRKRSLSKPAAKPRHYARITDFFAKRRRSTDTKIPIHSSSSDAAQCKTIR
ncbi:cyclin-dependent kinase inhibitor 1Ca [Hippoglossus hippoglossus]|uniref:cyclin-dependent kinase inhibitor 1Ca n=1 Tax=Hippoglossus hippoglossus TaxID=8267 RepID=UPI00148E2307|nr:cyclin-dependent kinase inhibitor 1Ca [Hippoglossus hippoglossus]